MARTDRSIHFVREPFPSHNEHFSCCRAAGAAKPGGQSGCYSGLFIEMEELPPSPVQLSVRLPDGTALERECLPQLCVLGTLFEGVSAPSVEVTVTMDGKTETFTAQLAYELFYPNGEDCGDPCRVTTIYLKSLTDRLAAA